MGFPGGSVGKESAFKAGDAGDMGSIPGLGRFPGGGHSNPLQYSCLENPVDRGAWQYLTYMQSTSCEMLGWVKHKLESRLLGYKL